MTDVSEQIKWYEKRINLLNLYSFLTEIGLEPEMPRFLEKPYNWEQEWELMQKHPTWHRYDAEQLDQLASELIGE